MLKGKYCRQRPLIINFDIRPLNLHFKNVNIHILKIHLKIILLLDYDQDNKLWVQLASCPQGLAIMIAVFQTLDTLPLSSFDAKRKVFQLAFGGSMAQVICISFTYRPRVHKTLIHNLVRIRIRFLLISMNFLNKKVSCYMFNCSYC